MVAGVVERTLTFGVALSPAQVPPEVFESVQGEEPGWESQAIIEKIAQDIG